MYDFEGDTHRAGEGNLNEIIGELPVNDEFVEFSEVCEDFLTLD